jgi:endonuclease YncB( thermonuclease family)
VGLKFERIEENGNFVGRVFHPAGNIAAEIVRQGFAKVNQPRGDSTEDYDPDYMKDLKQAQMVAQ